MIITASRPINGIAVNGDEYLLDESGELLEFETVQEAIRFFADRNLTITDLLELDFHIEEDEENKEVNSWPLSKAECEEAIAKFYLRGF
jgi:hypothetical protein